MRIYFAGAFSEGKTLLKNKVAKEYNLTAIPEQVRVIAGERELESLAPIRIHPDQVEEFQIETLKRQFESEKAVGDNFVSCRCIDNVAFLGFFGGRYSLNRLRNSKIYKEYINWLTMGDEVIFYMLPHKNLISSDGFRDTDWELALQISGAVKMVLEMEGVRYIPVHPLAASDRERIIFNYIDSRKTIEHLKDTNESRNTSTR